MEHQNGSCENLKNGEVDNSNFFIPEFLQQCVESIARKEGFISHNVIPIRISTEMANHLAIVIKGNTISGDKDVNLFVKNKVFFSDNIERFASSTDAYITEGFVYKDLSKVFKQLEDKAGIPVEDRYKMVKGYDESSSEAIILENVAKKGFKTCDRKKVVPLRFVELSVEQLAKFHALGFAIKKIMPDFFEQKISKMKYPWKYNKYLADIIKNIANVSMKNLREDLKKKAEVFLLTALEKLERYYTKDTTTIRTLCHGDFKNLNIMMKEEEGEVTEVIPVDFQFVYYGCPANDILYFLYGCTDRQFRRQHMDNVVNLYYDTLKNFLKYFDIDVADVYPREKFDAAMEDRADLGLIIALGTYPLFFVPEDNISDLNDDVKTKNMDLDPEIVGRIEEIMEDLVDLGLL